jgi:hypothetical protein
MKNDGKRERGDGGNEFDFPRPSELFSYEPDPAHLNDLLFGLSFGMD